MHRQFKSINLTYKIKKSLKFSRVKMFSIFFFIFGLLLPLILLSFFTNRNAQNKIVQQSEFANAPDTRVGIVFGSSLDSDGSKPDQILQDRLDSAYELYKLGKIQKIIVSGDNSSPGYNEPIIMNKYLVEQGIPEFDITQDLGGESTYHTCFRAKEVYGVSKALLITQEFHLPRAIYLCENFGIESYGASADKSVYDNLFYNRFREIFALASAYYEVNINPPDIELGEKVGI